MRRAVLSLLAGLSALLVASPSRAGEVGLAADGSVLRLRSGLYADLFPNGHAAEPTASVLALDVRHSDGKRERLLVPGSADLTPESSVRLVVEPASQVAYLLWQGLVGGLHPVLYLTSFDGSGWSDLIEVVAGVFAEKGEPDLVITRQASEDGTSHTVAHLTWWQMDGAVAVSRKLYAQVILENGEYLGWAPVVDLSSLLPPSGTLGLAGSDVANLLRVLPGKDSQSVLVGFLDPVSQSLRVVEATVLPAALVDLTEKLRAQIIHIGAKVATSAELADRLGAFIRETAAAFHPAIREYFAAAVAETVIGSPLPLDAGGASDLADKLRAQIIHIGAKIGTSGVSDGETGAVLGVGPEAGSTEYRLLTRLTLVSDLAAPLVGGPARLFLSQSGRAALVAWDEGDRVVYRESTAAGGWTDPASIEVAADLDRDAIDEVLAARVRSR